MWELTAYMQLMARQKASDCFFRVGAPPSIKIEGNTVHLGAAQLSSDRSEEHTSAVT